MANRHGQKRSPENLADDAWSVRPTQEMAKDAAEELQELRKLDPSATRSDLVRIWYRAASRKRYTAAMMKASGEAREFKELARLATQKAARLERDLSMVENEETRRELDDKRRLLQTIKRAIAKQPSILQELRDAARVETTSSIPIASRIPILRSARDLWGSYADVLQVVEDPE